jgi:hypothetical protein
VAAPAGTSATGLDVPDIAAADEDADDVVVVSGDGAYR